MSTPTSSEDPKIRFWVPTFQGDRLAVAAYQWMVDNPRVMDLYERFALQALQSKKRFGVKLITERIRWELHIDVNAKSDDYKINNNHSAYIARWLLFRYPQFKPHLAIRSSPGAKSP